jgi:hypothetical protein
MSDWKQNPKPKLSPKMKEILHGLEDVKGLLESQIDGLVKEIDKANSELVKLNKRLDQVKKGQENPPRDLLSQVEEVEDINRRYESKINQSEK